MADSGFLGFVETHSALTIGVVAVGGVLILGYINKNKAAATAASGTGQSNLSGLATDANGNHLVYVPTSTSFTTQNIGAQFSNDPNLTSIKTGNIVTNSPVTVQTPVTVRPVDIPPKSRPPVVPPKPPVLPPTKRPPVPTPVHYGLVWGAHHTVSSDDTQHGAGALAYIASQSTNIMRTQQHAPSSVSINAGDIARHNSGLRSNSTLHIGQTIVIPSYERIG